MFKFRGQRKDNGEWVVGCLINLIEATNEGKVNLYGIYNADMDTVDEVKKETLSISTGKLDSTGTEIFASFEIDGVMTSGGDVVRMLNGMQNFKVVYDLHGTRFAIATMNGDVLGGIVNTDISYTIIGKGAENDKS